MGVRPERLGEFLSRARNIAGVELTGLCTHLAEADSDDPDPTQKQLETFARCRAQLQAAGFHAALTHVANSAGTTVSNLLSQLQQKALAASDTSLDANSRAALNNDFIAIRNQITTTVQNADFNGVNLINGTVTKITSLANAQGTSVITTAGQNLTLGGGLVTLTATTTIGTVTTATAAISTVETSLQNVDNALATLGTASNALNTHLTFVSDLQDTLTTGVGNLVNADLAKESATLQALQTKQQLGIQALSIANASSSVLLGLFR